MFGPLLSFLAYVSFLESSLALTLKELASQSPAQLESFFIYNSHYSLPGLEYTLSDEGVDCSSMSNPKFMFGQSSFIHFEWSFQQQDG